MDRRNNFVFDSDAQWESAGEKILRKIMSFDENLMIVKVKFEKGGIGSPHSHPHLQSTYVESGEFKVNIGGREEILKAGDTFSVPSNTEHGVINIEEGILIDVFNPAREDFLK